jgi:hypothetical protein
MIEHTLEHNKKIRVYDDLFTSDQQDKFYTYANSSYFRLGWADGTIIENQIHRFLHSTYSNEDMVNLGILDAIRNTEAAHELDGYKIEKCILNLSTASDANFTHTHPEDKILLYYVNLEWRDGWHGETLFFSENKKNILFASPYAPGRLISFDAKIPHTIRPQSHLASFYRFTLALVLNKC